MLYLQDGATPVPSGWQQWHVGEPLPTITKRVVVFQADGDELKLFTDAMKGHTTNIDRLLNDMTHEQQIHHLKSALINALEHTAFIRDALKQCNYGMAEEYCETQDKQLSTALGVKE